MSPGYYVAWRICQRGHTQCYSDDAPDVSDWMCVKCQRPCAASGVIDQSNEKEGYGDDINDFTAEMAGWDALHKAQDAIRRQWETAHPDDVELVDWREGTIITHKDCGGLGVVCTCPEGEYEPSEHYVRWVVIPDWNLPTTETSIQSVWLSGRLDNFVRAEPIPGHF